MALRSHSLLSVFCSLPSPHSFLKNEYSFLPHIWKFILKFNISPPYMGAKIFVPPFVLLDQIHSRCLPYRKGYNLLHSQV